MQHLEQRISLATVTDLCMCLRQGGRECGVFVWDLIAFGFVAGGRCCHEDEMVSVMEKYGVIYRDAHLRLWERRAAIVRVELFRGDLSVDDLRSSCRGGVASVRRFTDSQKEIIFECYFQTFTLRAWNILENNYSSAVPFFKITRDRVLKPSSSIRGDETAETETGDREDRAEYHQPSSSRKKKEKKEEKLEKRKEAKKKKEKERIVNQTERNETERREDRSQRSIPRKGELQPPDKLHNAKIPKRAGLDPPGEKFSCCWTRTRGIRLKTLKPPPTRRKREKDRVPCIFAPLVIS